MRDVRPLLTALSNVRRRIGRCTRSFARWKSRGQTWRRKLLPKELAAGFAFSRQYCVVLKTGLPRPVFDMSGSGCRRWHNRILQQAGMLLEGRSQISEESKSIA